MNTKNTQNENSGERDIRNNSDPIIQANDETGSGSFPIQQSEAFLSSVNPVTPVTNVTPIPDRFIGMLKPGRPVQTTSSIIESLLRFKWTIVIVSILIAVPVVAAIWISAVPKYRARAEVQVRPFIPYLVYRTEDNGMIPLYTSFVNTQVSIIKGMTVLQRALDQKKIQQTQWYKTPDESYIQRLRGSTLSPMERLQESLSVRPRSGTWIIDVSFLAVNSKEAELVVNSVLEQYMKYIGEMSNASEDALYRQLNDEYNKLQNEIQGREKIVADISKDLGTGSPQELVAGMRTQLNEAQENLNKIQQSIGIIDWKIQRAAIKDSNSSEAAAGEQVQSMYYEDSEWRKLDIDVKTLESQIKNSIFTEKHPDRIAAEKNLVFVKELLRNREGQLDKELRKYPENIAKLSSDANSFVSKEMTGTLEYQREQLKLEEKILQDDFSKKKEEFGKFFESAQSLEKESAELLHKRDIFSNVRQRLEQKNMERNVPGSIEVSAWGFASNKPYNDRRAVFSVMAIGFALCMGCGVAMLRAGKNQVVYTPHDIPQLIQIPLLGYIPVVNLKKSLGKALSHEIMQKQFLLNESIRFVRTALLSRLDSTGSTTVLITSSVSGTGKSSFTVNLGNSLAQADKQVLMIDTDFHKMSLTDCYDLKNKPGLIDYLKDGTTEIPYVYITKTPGLSVMPVGERISGKTVFEEIANGSFQKSLDQLRRRYQVILLDSPPILPVADATIMAGNVDGTIMVERELVSRRENVTNAIERLTFARGNLLGIVFVGSPDEKHYGYNYDSYYGGSKIRS